MKKAKKREKLRLVNFKTDRYDRKILQAQADRLTDGVVSEYIRLMTIGKDRKRKFIAAHKSVA